MPWGTETGHVNLDADSIPDACPHAPAPGEGLHIERGEGEGAGVGHPEPKYKSTLERKHLAFREKHLADAT